MKNQINLAALDEKGLKFPKTLFLVVTMVALLVIGIVGYSFNLGYKMSADIAPLVDATMEIKLETSTAHLWFEEIISGDSNESMEQVIEHIDNAIWYADAMLNGGTNPEGNFVPLANPVLRNDIREVIAKIKRFKEILEQRYAAIHTSGVGTPIDQKVDALFEDFQHQADLVESKLQASIASDLTKYQYLQFIVLASIILLTITLLFVFYRFEKKRIESLRLFQQAQKQVKVLSGFLPICGTCKNILDDDGYWHRIENYIKDNSEAVLSDSICPQCEKKLVHKFCPADH